jgi:hypothetical protein
MTAELLKARVAGQFEALDWVITNIDTERFGRRPQVDKWSAHERLDTWRGDGDSGDVRAQLELARRGHGSMRHPPPA